MAKSTRIPFALNFAVKSTMKLPRTPPRELAAVNGPIIAGPLLKSLSTIRGMISL